MGFFEAIRSGFLNYFNFSGRASRSEYWYWILFVTLLAYPILILDAVLGYSYTALGGPFSIIFYLLVFIPNIAVAVRRLHDTSRSGWWLLIMLLPLVGFVVLIIFYCLKGDDENKFGKNPLNSLTTVTSVEDGFSKADIRDFPDSVLTQIGRYGELRDKDILTEEEFLQKNKELLNQNKTQVFKEKGIELSSLSIDPGQISHSFGDPLKGETRGPSDVKVNDTHKKQLDLAVALETRRSKQKNGLLSVLGFVIVSLLIFTIPGFLENGSTSTEQENNSDPVINKEVASAEEASAYVENTSQVTKVSSDLLQEIENAADALISDVENMERAKTILDSIRSGKVNPRIMEDGALLLDEAKLKAVQLVALIPRLVSANNYKAVIDLMESHFFLTFDRPEFEKWRLPESSIRMYEKAASELAAARVNLDKRGQVNAINDIEKTLWITAELFEQRQMLESELVDLGNQKVIAKLQKLFNQKRYDDFVNYSSIHQNLVRTNTSLSSLLEQAQARALDNRLSTMNKAAEQAEKAEDWSKAASIYRKALAISPQGNESTLAKLRRAEEIHSMISKVRDLLKLPKRLSDSSVRRFGSNLVEDAAFFSGASNLLDDLRNELASLLDETAIPVKVKIISNKIARIDVVGQGFISPTLEKTIELKEGDYTLIGRCAGHRDRIEKISVRRSKLMQVRVGCGSTLN